MSRSPIGMTIDHRGLHALDGYAQEQLAALPHGTYNVRFAKMTGKYKEQREGLRGLWFAGCELLSQNTEQDGFATKRAASNSLLVGMKMTRRKYHNDKTWEPIPISLSEDNLDDEEMLTILEMARAYCLDRFGFDPFEMWKQEQEAMNGGRR